MGLVGYGGGLVSDGGVGLAGTSQIGLSITWDQLLGWCARAIQPTLRLLQKISSNWR
jgi:hypothetical protein